MSNNSTNSIFFSMGSHTFPVSVNDLFVTHRQKLISKLLYNTEEECDCNDDFVVYIEGGLTEYRNDTDHEPIFRQESYFAYLTGVKEPDCSLVITSSNSTILLVPKLPQEYATIMGPIRTCQQWKELYQVDHVIEYNSEQDVEDLLLKLLQDEDDALTTTKEEKQEDKKVSNGIISNHPPTNDSTAVTSNNGGTTTNANNNGSHTTTNGGSTTSNGSNNKVTMNKKKKKMRKKLLLMKGLNSDSGNMYEPPSWIENNSKLFEYIDTTTLLFPVLAECRVIKSTHELALIRYVTEITSFAHAYVMRNWSSSDKFEYQAESLFRHYIYYNYGMRHTGYTSICGCGPSNSAILHYGHAGRPNDQQANESSSMCLLDMGAEYYFYGSDVTCSFPSCGNFDNNPCHKVVYQAVYNAQVAVYDIMKPGVSWVDCHKTAEAAILLHLEQHGLIRKHDKTISELVEMRLCAVFMPHGLGHFVGIDTHDVGGYLPGHPDRIALPGLKSLRTARILQPNMVLTVEPGCYFIDHLLDEAFSDVTLSQYLVKKEIEKFRGMGGVRLEDVVQLTETGIVNYTLCPRTISEVEHVLNGGLWPPIVDKAPELRRERLTHPTPLPRPSPPSL